VLVEVAEAESKSASGLIIARTPEPGDILLGTVKVVGSGKVQQDFVIPMTVKVGDEIMFNYGTRVNYDGKEYFLVMESDIMMITRQ